MSDNGETKITEITSGDDDKIFNQLKELQKLIKKESAIKELFIKSKNKTKNTIDCQCVDIYKKKMEVLNILQKINNTKSNSTNILKDYILTWKLQWIFI